jgi:magnesium-transporting ATPase (P-type)
MRDQNPIPFDSHPFAMVLGAVAVVGILAAVVVVGPSGVFHFLFGFLLPMAVVVLVVVGTIGLLAREGGKVLDSRDTPPRTDPRAPSRGGELSVAVYWLLMGLFLLASVAMVCFFWLVVRDQWIHHRPLVAGRLDAAESMRVLFLLLATVAVSSGLLWRHHKRIDAYGSRLEPIFMAAFTLCAALAAVVALPALFFVG